MRNLFLSALIFVTFGAFLFVHSSAPASAANTYYYLGAYQAVPITTNFGTVVGWVCPEDCVGSLDYRLDSSGPGYGLFSYNTPENICSTTCLYDGIDLGDNLDVVNVSIARQIYNYLPTLSFSGSTLREILLSALVDNSDPAGITGLRTYVSQTIYLGNEPFYVYPTEWYRDIPTSYRFQKSLELYQDNYAEYRAEDRASGSYDYLRVLASYAERFGLPYTDFLGSLPNEGTLPAHSECLDSFTDTDGTYVYDHSAYWEHIGPGPAPYYSVIDIQSNRARQQGYGYGDFEFVRTACAFSSADSWVKSNVATSGLGNATSTTQAVGIWLRKPADTQCTGYQALAGFDDGGYIGSGNFVQVLKWPSGCGSYSVVGTGVSTLDLANDSEFMFLISGSNLYAYVDGTLRFTASDSTLSAGKESGLGGLTYDYENYWDNFVFSDDITTLTPTPTSTPTLTPTPTNTPLPAVPTVTPTPTSTPSLSEQVSSANNLAAFALVFVLILLIVILPLVVRRKTQ